MARARAVVASAGIVSGPLIIAGIGQSELLADLHRDLRAAESRGIFRRRLFIVHEHEPTMWRALADPALEAAADDATEWFLGSGAVERLRDWMQQHPDDALPTEVLHDSTDAQASRLAERVRRQLVAADGRQQLLAKTLRAKTHASGFASAPMDARRAFESARAGRRSLRVLICGSRYTTYVKHSAFDLADAFRTLGHEPRVLMERDASSRLTAISYMRACDEHRPDLIVVINYTRSMLGDALPPGVPCVCWIQDAMPQFFTEAAGRAQTETDMTAGNTMPELFTAYHYPQHAAMPFCVPASASKFHASPVDSVFRQRFACEVAFVSHHSESPEELRDRLARESNAGPRTDELLLRLYECAIELVASAHEKPVRASAERVAAEAFQGVYGDMPSATQRSLLVHSMLLPLAGRMFRHQSLEWAAAICDRRGWRLRLFGNGWERSAAFARYAAGPVEHGEDLRACYQSAAVSLHLDINTLTHQRVFECALSGGLPVARFFGEALEPLREAAIDELLDTAEPVGVEPDGSRVFRMSEAPLGAMLEAQSTRLGLTHDGLLRAAPGRRALGRFFRERTSAPFDACSVMGGLDGIVFTDAASLEVVLTRAIEDSGWRDARSETMREGIQRTTTTEVFARRLIEHAARVIGWREARDAVGCAWPPRPEDEALYRRILEEGLDAG